MRTITALSILSIGLIPAYCKGAESEKKPKIPTQLSGKALVDELLKVARTNPESRIDASLEAETLGFPNEAKAVEWIEEPKQEKDWLVRMLKVVLDPSTTTVRALGAVMETGKPGPTSADVVFNDFRMSPAGELEKAVYWTAKNDANGEPVEGSRQDAVQDVHAPEVKAEFQRELTFWLKQLERRRRKTGSKNKKPTTTK